jgi:hypothetical protein
LLGRDFNVPDGDMHRHLHVELPRLQVFPFGPTCTTPTGTSNIDYFVGSRAVGHRLQHTAVLRNECPTHVGLQVHLHRLDPVPAYRLDRPGTPPIVKGQFGPRWEAPPATWDRHRAGIDILQQEARRIYQARQSAPPHLLASFDLAWRAWYMLIGDELTRNFGATRSWA